MKKKKKKKSIEIWDEERKLPHTSLSLKSQGARAYQWKDIKNPKPS
jgi:TfoX/Sxy family transcriptional regulator of competence genes